MPEVRRALVEKQRAFARRAGRRRARRPRHRHRRLPGCAREALRHRGPPRRARGRRAASRSRAGASGRVTADVLDDIRRRDARDMAAPIRRCSPPKTPHLLDTTEMDYRSGVPGGLQICRSARSRRKLIARASRELAERHLLFSAIEPVRGIRTPVFRPGRAGAPRLRRCTVTDTECEEHVNTNRRRATTGHCRSHTAVRSIR